MTKLFWIGEGQRQLKLKYDIKKRKYIGNSTMDPELAFVQANLALCRQGLLAIDPFCGTGGILAFRFFEIFNFMYYYFYSDFLYLFSSKLSIVKLILSFFNFCFSYFELM